MIGDAEVFTRRSLRSMEILRGMHDVTFEQWQLSAFDTDVYWARHELPHFAEVFAELKTKDVKLAKRVWPYLQHLLKWDAKITVDSTAATLCHAWYEQLYGWGYPGEEMRECCHDQPLKQLEALARAAENLQEQHGLLEGSLR